MKDTIAAVRPGFQVFLEEGGEECGAVREVAPDGRPELVVYVENGGEFVVPGRAVRGVHDGKVVLDRTRLDETMLDAIRHAHDGEVPGL